MVQRPLRVALAHADPSVPLVLTVNVSVEVVRSSSSVVPAASVSSEASVLSPPIVRSSDDVVPPVTVLSDASVSDSSPPTVGSSVNVVQPAASVPSEASVLSPPMAGSSDNQNVDCVVPVSVPSVAPPPVETPCKTFCPKGLRWRDSRTGRFAKAPSHVTPEQAAYVLSYKAAARDEAKEARAAKAHEV